MPKPEFRESFGGFEVIFYQDRYTEKYLKELGLNDRQVKAVMYVKEKGKVSNKEYQELNAVSERTALRELSGLTGFGLLRKTY